MKFDWDPRKAASNLEKHGVSFELARHIYADPKRLELVSERNGEERIKIIGEISALVHVVVVVERETVDGQEVIRIISARRASRNERQVYSKIW